MHKGQKIDSVEKNKQISQSTQKSELIWLPLHHRPNSLHSPLTPWVSGTKTVNRAIPIPPPQHHNSAQNRNMSQNIEIVQHLLNRACFISTTSQVRKRNRSRPSVNQSMTATPLPRLQLHIIPLDGRPRLITPPPTVGRPGNPEPQGRPGADRGIQSAAPRRPGVLLAHYLSDKTEAIRERYRAVSAVVRRRQIRYTLRHRARSVFRGARSAAAATGCGVCVVFAPGRAAVSQPPPPSAA